MTGRPPQALDQGRPGHLGSGRCGLPLPRAFAYPGRTDASNTAQHLAANVRASKQRFSGLGVGARVATIDHCGRAQLTPTRAAHALAAPKPRSETLVYPARSMTRIRLLIATPSSGDLRLSRPVGSSSRMTRRSSALSSRKSWLTDDLRISVPANLGSSQPYPNPAAGQSSWAPSARSSAEGRKTRCGSSCR